MGEVVQLPLGNLTRPGMSVVQVEAMCLETAARLAASAAEWTRWQLADKGVPALLGIAEELTVDLLRHNRRHLRENQVTSIERLQDLERRMRSILQAVSAVRDRITDPPSGA